MNIGEEYEGRSKAGPWMDAHLRLTGPAVPQLLEEFAADWDFSTIEGTPMLDAEAPWAPAIPAGDGDREGRTATRGWIQTVSGGPDQHANRIRELLFFVCTRARHRLWIATPYLVPDDAMLTALCTAARAGVEVVLITQNNRPDHMLAYWASRYYWERLMEAGVRVHQYRPGMMHAKMLLADNRFASVGSANLDVRSLALNFELNVVFYSRREIRRVESIMRGILAECDEVGSVFHRRSWFSHLIENGARLFAPVL